jgi:hypothetical protein
MTGSEVRRDQADLARLVRHLSAGLSLWRLYPGQSQRSDVSTAIELTQQAASDVLGHGPARIDVRPAGLFVDEEPMPTSVHNERLARALYDRRISHLDIIDHPTAPDIQVLLEVMTQPVGELDDAGGAGDVLSEAGVTGIVLWAGEPEPLLAMRGEHDELKTRERDHKQPTIPPVDLSAATTGGDMYRMLTEHAQHLPEDEADRAEFHRRAQEAVAALPLAERAEFGRQVLRNAVSESFAERYVGQLTDPRLAQLAVEVAEAEGSDPEELAAKIVEQAGRHSAVVRLVSAAVRRHQDEVEGDEDADAGGDGAALPVEDPQLAAATIALHHSVMRGAAPAVGGHRPGGPVLDTPIAVGPDVQAVRAAYPTTTEDVRVVSLDALRDYLDLEDDLPQLAAVAAALGERLRRACIDLQQGEVRLLIDTVEQVLPHLSAAAADIVVDSCNAVVDSMLATELAGSVVTGGELDDVVAVLRPLGPQAVEAVVAALADEDRSPFRRVHVSLLAAIAGPYADVLTPWLQDPRWYVVRNIATALGRIGGNDVVDPLLRLGRHADERVRREASRSLIAAVGARGVTTLTMRARHGDEETFELIVETLGSLPATDAAQAIAELVGSAPSRPAARQALETLGGHDSPAATELLREIAAGRRAAGIGWLARARARRLARSRGGRQ